jgi:hypothetical protein
LREKVAEGRMRGRRNLAADAWTDILHRQRDPSSADFVGTFSRKGEKDG